MTKLLQKSKTLTQMIKLLKNSVKCLLKVKVINHVCEKVLTYATVCSMK